MDASSSGLLSEFVGQGFFRGSFIAAVLISLCTLVHFYSFLWAGRMLKRLHKRHHLQKIVVLMFTLFATHTAHVWLFAFGYMALIEVMGAGYFVLGSSGAMFDGGFVDYLYYSIVTYTTLGFGDIVPSGGIRLLTGIEALLGLLMIAWSASFTYLEMEKHFKKLP